jgi:hypothetical protein
MVLEAFAVGLVVSRWFAVPLCAVVWSLRVYVGSRPEPTLSNFLVPALLGAVNACLGVIIRRFAADAWHEFKAERNEKRGV